jgi:riboflavin biosynthesis pyrimidine reductase
MVKIRVAEGRSAQPLAVVVSRSGRIPFDIPLFADPRSVVAVYAPPGTPIPPCAAEVITHPVPPGDDELSAVLRSLRREHGVRSLLCEGGPALLDSMLAEGLVDELFLTLAPVLVGGAEPGITAGAALPALIPLRLVWALEFESHLFLRYER